jgi:hypothetical protein
MVSQSDMALGRMAGYTTTWILSGWPVLGDFAMPLRFATLRLIGKRRFLEIKMAEDLLFEAISTLLREDLPRARKARAIVDAIRREGGFLSVGGTL